jgi:hypothetical protein
LYKSSTVTDSVTLQPTQVWDALDSFWRSKVIKSDADMVLYQTMATLVLCANTVSRSQHFIDAQGIATLEPYANIPWHPIVLFRDQLVDLSYVLYGDPYIYDTPPEIVYNQTADPQFTYPVLPTFAEITTLYNSITETTEIFDAARFSYDRGTRTLTFTVDPFSVLTPLQTTNGRQYAVLWVRNGKLDLNVPFDWTGWVIKFQERSTYAYVKALRELWELDVSAPTIGVFKSGITTGAGFPVSLEAAQVTDIRTDGYQRVVFVGNYAYPFPVAIPAAVAIGDNVTAEQPLSQGVRFFAGLEAATAPTADLPGIAFTVPLPSGQDIILFAPNQTLAWSFDALRPSPWRFPLGGDPVDVEAYWTDRNVDLSLYYVLAPAQPVNPMQLLVTDLWKSALTIATMDLATIEDAALSFVDRAKMALSPSTYIIVQQKVAAVADPADVVDTAPWPDVVGYGYHAGGISDTISVSGTDLILSDYAPMVTLS